MATKFFRDPVHGLIEFTGHERALMKALDSPLMQRLRRIKQCGFADCVYPSLSHTRFEHSLGCFHVMKRYLQRLSDIVAEPVEAESIADYVREDTRQFVGDPWSLRLKAAALLHDCGHTAFSHATEALFPPPDGEMKAHERWGIRLVKENLAELDPVLATEVATLLRQSYAELGSGPALATQLLSSAIDCDRLDYLSRDTHHSGVNYGTIDLNWILRALELSYSSSPLGIAPVVAYHDRRGLWALDQLLSARRTMYLQVYLHRVVHVAGFMYQRIVQRALDVGSGTSLSGPIAVFQKMRELPQDVTTGEYLSVDDFSVWAQLTLWSHGQDLGSDPLLRTLCEHFLQRRLFAAIEVPQNLVSTSTIESEILPKVAEAAADHDPYSAFTRTEALQYLCGVVALEERLMKIGAAKLYYIPTAVASSKIDSTEAIPLDHHPLIGPRVAQEIVIRQWIVVPREVKAQLQDELKALKVA